MIKYFPNEHTSARNLQQELLALLTVDCIPPDSLND